MWGWQNLPVYYRSWLKGHLGWATTSLSIAAIQQCPRGLDREQTQTCWGRWSVGVTAPVPSSTGLEERVQRRVSQQQRIEGEQGHMGLLKAVTSAKQGPDPHHPSPVSQPSLQPWESHVSESEPSASICLTYLATMAGQLSMTKGHNRLSSDTQWGWRMRHGPIRLYTNWTVAHVRRLAHSTRRQQLSTVSGDMGNYHQQKKGSLSADS